MPHYHYFEHSISLKQLRTAESWLSLHHEIRRPQ